MGIYTNHTLLEGYSPTSVYTDVEPFKGEYFNYHELGIIAATESASNRDAFMKAIALNELASVEQYGTDQVFYEAVNVKGVFDRIKAFFKKIIEKIHKIFHTFIAKMGSWFQSSKDFAKKYEKEIIKNWGLVKNDWEFKGYKFKNIVLTKGIAENISQEVKTNRDKDDPIRATLKASTNPTAFAAELAKYAKSTIIEDNVTITWYVDDENNPTVYIWKSSKDFTMNGQAISKSKYYDAGNNDNEYVGDVSILKQLNDTDNVKTKTKTNSLVAKLGGKTTAISNTVITKFREDFNEKGKDQIRYQIVEYLKKGNLVIPEINCDFNDSGAYDSKEFTEELHNALYGEDDKEDLEKKDIESLYGSMTGMLNFMKEYDKIKSNIEKAERTLVKTIDDRIKAVDTAQDNLIKDKTNSSQNEGIIQISAVFQSFWGFVKECETQAFSAFLSALKDCCSQAKQIAVKVVGLNKKMTEESVDYSNSNDFNFIDAVKLV